MKTDGKHKNKESLVADTWIRRSKRNLWNTWSDTATMFTWTEIALEPRWLRIWILRTDYDFPPSYFGLLEVPSVWCVLGKKSTRTRLVLHQHCPIHDILETVWTNQFCLAKTSLNVGTQQFCLRDKAPNQRKRTPLLLAAWQLCRSIKYFSPYEIASQSIVDIPNNYCFGSRINFCEISDKCLILSKSVFLVIRRFSW